MFEADMIERAIWTGVQSGLALVTLDGLTAFNSTSLETLAVAGVAAALSALKTVTKVRLEALKEAKEG